MRRHGPGRAIATLLSETAAPAEYAPRKLFVIGGAPNSYVRAFRVRVGEALTA